MTLIFIDSEIIETTNYVTYIIQNFISDIGGLAGLFLGFSLLSLFEIILRMISLCKKVFNRLLRRKTGRVRSIQNSKQPSQNLQDRPVVRIVNEKSRNQNQTNISEIVLKYDRYVYNKW